MTLRSAVRALAALLPLVALACAAPPPRTPDEALARLADDYLERWYQRHPVRSTELGLHEHDRRLPDWSRAAVRVRLEELDAFAQRLDAIDADGLSGTARHDRRILEHALGAERFRLETTREHERDPRLYNAAVARAAASLAEREFAPLEDRLEDLTRRLRAVRRHLRTARANLVVADVPPLWVELAQRDAAGTLRFLESDLPAMLADQEGDASESVRRAFDAARREALRAVGGYRDWLAADLAPRAQGDFRLGEARFLEKLRLEEFVEATADELWERNEEAIARYREWVERVVGEIDPDRSAAEVMAELTADHPASDELVPTAERMMLEARAFVLENELVTLPSERLPIVRPTPPYARIGFASMSTPGPFERVATEAYYNITGVDPDWTEEEQAQHLTYFNRPGLLGITVHEAMPGHFVQLLWEQEIPTEVRRVFTPASLVEGWAHYAEQMMVDEGLGGGDPRIRLGQLRRALQRHARWYAGMALHVRGATIEEAAARFREIAYFAEFPALREVQRATFDATYLYYALGRMQILALREEVAAARGEAFSLREFHDELLRLGLPLTLAREVLLAEDDA